MPYVKEKKSGLPTLGIFVPCDPRIDETSRKRAFNIRVMTTDGRTQQNTLKELTGLCPCSGE